MTGSRPAIALIVGLLALCLGSTAQAQDLWEGKSPQQLFRLNCAACHKSPAGLARAGEKAGGLFGLENFLAQHYTASGRSAQIIASYLKSVDSGAARQRTRRPSRRVTRPRKPAAAKPDSTKKSDSAKQTDTAKASEKTSGQPDKMTAGEDKAKTDAPKADAAKMTDDKSGASEADKPKMTGPKPDQKEVAAPTTEAKRETPKAAGDKPAGDDADKKTN